MQSTRAKYGQWDPERERRESITAEANVVGAWLARAGVLAILIGAGFAYKYAIDSGFIGPSARVAIGIAAGVAFVVWGEWARRRHWDLFAQAVTGGGLAMAYLSVLAAVQLYHLIPGPVAFGALVVIAVAGGLLALRHDSAALAALALIGAFLNPFLVAVKQEPNPVPTLYYLVALNLAVVAGAFRRWRGLTALAFAGTLIVFGVAQQDATPAVAGLFATALFAIYTAFPFFAPKPSFPEDITVSVLAGFAYLPYVEHQIALFRPDRAGLIAFGVAGAYAALAVLAHEIRRGDPILTRALFSLSAAAAIVAVPLALHGPSMTVMWAAQGVVLLMLGFRTRFVEGTVAGSALLEVATVLSFARLAQRFHPDQLFISGEGAATMAVIACLFAAALIIRNGGERQRPFALIPAWTGTMLALAWLSTEAVVYAERVAPLALRVQAEQFALSLVWAGFGAIALAIGVRARLLAARVFGTALLGVVVAKLVMNDVWMLNTGLRMIAFTVVGVLLIGCSVMYQRLRDLILEDEPSAEEAA